MNSKYDYDALEREYVTGTMSIRDLCAMHDISAAKSAVISAAKRRGWVEKRELFRSRSSALTIEKTADREAERYARQLSVQDNAVAAIDEAITRLREDMRKTTTRMKNGEFVEEPLIIVRVADLSTLIDKMNVLFGRPSTISEERNLGLSLSAEGLPADFLRAVIDATGAVGGPIGGPAGSSALPRTKSDRSH